MVGYTPLRQAEVVIPVSGSSNSAGRTRSTAKRLSSLSLASESPSKRPKQGDGSPAPGRYTGMNAYALPFSSNHSPTATRTPTKIIVPKPGDLVGPSSRSSTIRSSIDALTSKHIARLVDDDSEDEMLLKASPTRQSGAYGSAKGKEREGPTVSSRPKPPKFELPGKRTSSRKKQIVSDLMGRASAVETSPTRSQQASTSDATWPLMEASSSGSSLHVTETIAATAVDDHTGMQIDNTEVHIDTIDGGHRTIRLDASPNNDSPNIMPSPAPSNPSNIGTEASTRTPTKEKLNVDARKTPSKLVAPTVTPTKKRTPTKAVKTPGEAPILTTELIIPKVSQASAHIIPTPSSTPERTNLAAVRSKPAQRDFKRKAILELLRKVLSQLATPTHAIAATSSLKPSDEKYKNWLSSQPCLSPSHEVAEKDVRNTLDRTIREGEGNCLLLVGERGVGKTAVVKRSLKTLEHVYGTGGFLVVHLSGLVQRDDKSAVKEIARQLCSSSYIDEAENTEAGGSFTSNATILSSLLAVLEPGPSDDAEEAASKAKPLIFIIDEFDLFAHHSLRQSFLYCLLDCVQGGMRRAGMAVLGLSARADCIETLEKRVKSRCQSRVHHILPAEDVNEGIAAVLKESLSVSPTDADKENKEEAGLAENWNALIEAFLGDSTTQMQLTAMNELRGLDADRKPFDTMTILISRLVKVISNVPEDLISNRKLQLQHSDLAPFIQLPEREIPKSLSIVEVALLISAKHLIEEEKAFNFIITYDRYVEHCKRAAASGSNSSRPFSRGLCLRAFDRLKRLGLVRDAAVNAKQLHVGGGSIFRLSRLVPMPYTIEEYVKERKDIPQHLVKWCKAWSD